MAGDDADGRGKTEGPRNGSAKKRRMRRYALWAGPIILTDRL
jgi:hypothetical protein